MSDDAPATPTSTEAPSEHGSDFKGLQGAANELHQRREERGETEPPPKQRGGGDEIFKDARAASKVVARERRGEAADTLWTTSDPATAERAGREVFKGGDEPNEADLPTRIEYQDGRDKDQPVKFRQAVQDRADYLRNKAASDQLARAQNFKDQQINALVEVYGAETALKMMGGGEQAEQPVQEQPAEEQPRPEAPDPVAQARAQAEYERQAYAYARQASQAENAIAYQAQTLTQQHAAEFPDIKSWDDVQRMSPEQKSRWAQYGQAMDQLVALHKEAATQRQVVETQIDQARRQQEAQEFSAWKMHQDAIVAREVPEINNEKQGYAFRKAAHEMLNEYLGINPETAANVPPELKRALNYSGTQKLIADAVRYRLGREKALAATANSPPQPQRPGVAQSKGSQAAADVAYLSERIDRTKAGSERQLRLAAQLIATNRANRGR